MKLDDSQRQRVSAWINEGLKLSEIQSRLASEFGLKLTYMEARFLVDDLKLVPKDPEPPKVPEPPVSKPAAAAPTAAGLPPEDPEVLPPGGGGVVVQVDQITRPGAIISGKVAFSDGQTADWYIDQTGRLGLVAKQPGYKPTQADAQEFQLALQREVARLGY